MELSIIAVGSVCRKQVFFLFDFTDCRQKSVLVSNRD